MRKIFASVDIGSSDIKIVVLEDLNGSLNVLASNIYPSDGIKKGIIIDDDKVVNSLKKAFSEVNDSLGIKIDKVITSVPINNAKYKSSTGGSDQRVRRGYGDTLIGDGFDSPKRFGFGPSNQVTNDIGFRPVFEYKE